MRIIDFKTFEGTSDSGDVAVKTLTRERKETKWETHQGKRFEVPEEIRGNKKGHSVK